MAQITIPRGLHHEFDNTSKPALVAGDALARRTGSPRNQGRKDSKPRTDRSLVFHLPMAGSVSNHSNRRDSMTGTDVLKLIASMSEFGYSRREISYAMDIPLKDIKRLLRATG